MAGKINWALVILLAGVAIQLFVGWNASTLTTIIVGLGVLIGVLTMFRITINGINDTGKGTIIVMALILGVLSIFGVSASLLTAQLPTGSITEGQVTQTEGVTVSAIMALNMKDINGTYTGSNIVFAVPEGVVADRNDLMKKLYDGNTGTLLSGSMAVATGRYTLNGYTAKIGDTVVFAGYQDTAPGATDNVSFVTTAKITGLTAGSNPEWMVDKSSYTWYKYPTLLFYDDSDTARTVHTDNESSAIESHTTFSMFPTNNGERWTDAALWVESPEANIAAIKKVTISGVDMNGAAYVKDYGMPYEISSVENKFKAQPALTTATNKMYYVGEIPDGVRLSSSQRARITVVLTYDHPASGTVTMFWKVTQNTNALTTAGGHYDSPATNLNLTLGISAGADAWI